ncbi:hypothetical protein BX666DRAFT_1964375, partial [Dichotomocladium elegans]
MQGWDKTESSPCESIADSTHCHWYQGNQSARPPPPVYFALLTISSFTQTKRFDTI